MVCRSIRTVVLICALNLWLLTYAMFMHRKKRNIRSRYPTPTTIPFVAFVAEPLAGRVSAASARVVTDRKECLGL